MFDEWLVLGRTLQFAEEIYCFLKQQQRWLPWGFQQTEVNRCKLLLKEIDEHIRFLEYTYELYAMDKQTWMQLLEMLQLMRQVLRLKLQIRWLHRGVMVLLLCLGLEIGGGICLYYPRPSSPNLPSVTADKE